MPLHKPYFYLIPAKEGAPAIIRHNCNGGVDFCCSEEVTNEVARYVELAIEEGKRQKAVEIRQLLGITP